VLVGLSGTGKTSVAPMLSARLGWPAIDTDAEIERRESASVAELWSARGEAAFRRIESLVLAEALAGPGPVVVAAGGGVVLEEANRSLLARRAWVAWLKASPEALAARLGHPAGRPLLAGDLLEALRRLESQRQGLYRQVAQVELEVEDLDPEAVAEEVLKGWTTWSGAVGG